MKQQGRETAFILVYAAGFPYFRGDIYLCTGTLHLLRRSDISDGFASPVFVLAVLLTSRFTNGYLFGTLAILKRYRHQPSSPFLKFRLHDDRLSADVFVMLCVSLVTCTMTTKIKQQGSSAWKRARENACQLLRSVSHDIRTPLTSIIGSTSAILETPDLSLEQQHQLLGTCAMTRSGWSAWWKNLLCPSPAWARTPGSPSSLRPPRRCSARSPANSASTIPTSRYRWLCRMSCSSCRWMRSSLSRS